MRMIDFFDRGVAIGPDNICLTDGQRQLSYGEAQVLTYRIARALRRDGFGRGQNVAVYSPNDIIGYVCTLALNRADVISVPLNARNSVTDNIRHLQITTSECLFYHSEFEHH